MRGCWRKGGDLKEDKSIVKYSLVMKILVTGAKGFVGKNLCAALNNIKDGNIGFVEKSDQKNDS